MFMRQHMLKAPRVTKQTSTWVPTQVLVFNLKVLIPVYKTKKKERTYVLYIVDSKDFFMLWIVSSGSDADLCMTKIRVEVIDTS